MDIYDVFVRIVVFAGALLILSAVCEGVDTITNYKVDKDTSHASKLFHNVIQKFVGGIIFLLIEHYLP